MNPHDRFTSLPDWVAFSNDTGPNDETPSTVVVDVDQIRKEVREESVRQFNAKLIEERVIVEKKTRAKVLEEMETTLRDSIQAEIEDTLWMDLATALSEDEETMAEGMDQDKIDAWKRLVYNLRATRPESNDDLFQHEETPTQETERAPEDTLPSTAAAESSSPMVLDPPAEAGTSQSQQSDPAGSQVTDRVDDPTIVQPGITSDNVSRQLTPPPGNQQQQQDDAGVASTDPSVPAASKRPRSTSHASSKLHSSPDNRKKPREDDGNESSPLSSRSGSPSLPDMHSLALSTVEGSISTGDTRGRGK